MARQWERDGDGGVGSAEGEVFADEWVRVGGDARVDAVGGDGEGHVHMEFAGGEKEKADGQGRGEEEKEGQLGAGVGAKGELGLDAGDVGWVVGDEGGGAVPRGYGKGDQFERGGAGRVLTSESDRGSDARARLLSVLQSLFLRLPSEHPLFLLLLAQHQLQLQRHVLHLLLQTAQRQRHGVCLAEEQRWGNGGQRDGQLRERRNDEN